MIKNLFSIVTGHSNKPRLGFKPRRGYILVVFINIVIQATAQSVYTPLNNDYYHLIDRYEIKSGRFAAQLFTSFKPYLRKDIAAFIDTISPMTEGNTTDIKNCMYLDYDNWEWSTLADSGNSAKSFLGKLYQKKNSFYEFHNKDFLFEINPVAYLSVGKESYSNAGAASQPQNLFINTRGVELRGMIDKKIGFYGFFTDNQARFPQYVNEKVAASSVVPGEGFWKTFKNNGYDFFTANAYITFNLTKHITTQFGQDKNFIGNGYRSLLLSDNSSNYLFWKIDTKVGRLQYTNLYAEMVSDDLNHQTGDADYPRKYMALHYLSFNVCKQFNIGLFESVTFGNTDSIHNRGFDFNYLNPVIFYKAVDNGLGSADKEHLGMDFKWNFLRHFSFYGTVLVDEFLLREVLAQNGWWGNKQAGQLGLKYIDAAGIKNLDLQFEGNVVRPYTYSHFSFSPYTNYSYYSNYSNYDQPLAHPLGANFYEFIGILRYQPVYRLSFTGKIFYSVVGLDPPGLNYGSNIMLDYNTRILDYGNTVAQGIRTTITFLNFIATYQIIHNMFVDVNATVRHQDSELSIYTTRDNFFSISFRWNIPKRLQEF